MHNVQFRKISIESVIMLSNALLCERWTPERKSEKRMMMIKSKKTNSAYIDEICRVLSLSSKKNQNDEWMVFNDIEKGFVVAIVLLEITLICKNTNSAVFFFFIFFFFYSLSIVTSLLIFFSFRWQLYSYLDYYFQMVFFVFIPLDLINEKIASSCCCSQFNKKKINQSSFCFRLSDNMFTDFHTHVSGVGSR